MSTCTKICGLTEQDPGLIRAMKLFLRQELSKTKQDSHFVELVQLSQISLWFVYHQ